MYKSIKWSIELGETSPSPHTEWIEEVIKININWERLIMRNAFIKDRLLTYLKKDKDYGSSVQTTFEIFGETATAVRMADKINRIKKLMHNDDTQEVAESLQDTLLDLFNYIAMHMTLVLEGTLEIREVSDSMYELYDNTRVCMDELQEYLSVTILDDITKEYILANICTLAHKH